MLFSQRVNQIAARSSRKRSHASPRIHRACFEALEGRTLLSVSFQAPVPVASNISPTVAADLNGDGRADLVAIDASLPQVNVWLGNGDNTFQAPVALATPAKPTNVQVADINGDGHADILVTYATASGAASGLSIFMGNGDGSFQAPVNQDIGPNVVAVTAADFNGDGKTDLFASTSTAGPFQNTSIVQTYPGNGDGTFGAPLTGVINGVGVGVITGDFNGDGKADVVVAENPTVSATDLLTYNIGTLMGKGDGTFQLPVEQTVSSLPFGSVPSAGRMPTITSGDLNGDGISDVVVTINRDARSTVGGFFPPGTSPFGHASPIPVDTTGVVPGFVSVSLGSTAGLQPPVLYNASTGPGTAHIVDVNHDGMPDLVIQTVGAVPSDIPAAPGIFLPADNGGVTVLLNQGNGTFGNPTTYVVPVAGPIVIGDFNSDGNVDIYLAKNNTILEGNGDGTFHADASSYVGPGASTMAGNAADTQATGDFNGDGLLDVAVTNATVGIVSVFLGKGNGTFQNPVTYALGTNGTSGSGARGVVVGDMNGDGKLDLAFAVEGGAVSVAIMYGNGDGTFQQPFYEGAGGEPFSIAAADFNGDGLTDVLVTDPIARKATIFYSGPAGGGFSVATTDLPAAVIGDFNGDGKPDFATNSAVYLNTGSGFVQSSSISAGSGPTESMAVGDFNRDGKLDIAFHNAAPDTINFGITPPSAGAISIMLGNGDGTFTAPVVATVAQQIPQFSGGTYSQAAGSSIAVADFNGDGMPDLIVNGVNSVEISLGRGDGGFYPEQTISSTAGVAGQIALGDFNNDGKIDISEVDTGSNYPTDFIDPGFENVLLNNSTPDQFGSVVGFKMSAPPIVTENDPFAVTVSAVDANGNVVPGFMGAVSLYSDRGIATPYTFTTADAGTHTFNNAFDFIGGVHTLSASAPSLAPVNVSVTALPGHFSATYPSTTVAGAPVPLTISALDALGNPLTTFNAGLSITSSDLKARPLSVSLGINFGGTIALPVTPGFLSLMTAGNQTVSVTSPYMLPFTSAPILVTPGAATRAQFGLPAAVTAGVPFTFTVSAVDNFGNVSPIATPTINFSATGPGVTLPPSYTFTSADAGVHTFTATATVALSTFLDSGGGIVGSGLLQVNPAAITHLGLSSAVPQPTAGAGFTLLVSGYDAFGNQSPASIFHLTSSDARAILPADSSGIRSTFDTVSFKTAGTQTITVADPTNPSITAATETFNVTPATASTLLISTSKSAVAGAPQAVTITAQDTFGNLATGYRGTVHFLSTDVSATLPTDYTFTAADGGIHTFTTAFGVAGSQSITVQDTANVSVAGSEAGIVVVPGAAASFAVSGFPATVAGAAHTFTVTPKDAFGNIITGYTGTVKFSSSDLQAGLPANYTFTAADAGSHTFTATLKTAGTQSLTVSDTLNAAAGTQGGIAVTAGAASHLAVSGPSTVASGKATSITVTALDAYGNLATSYRGKVHFTDTVSAGLTSDYTFSATDNGSHTFNVTFNTVGLQTLKVTDTVISTITGSLSVTDSSSTGGGGGGGGGGKT